MKYLFEEGTIGDAYEGRKSVMLKIITHLLIFGYFFLIGADHAVGVTVDIQFTYRNGYTYEKELQAGWEIVVKELQEQIASHPDNAELSYALATVYWQYQPDKVQAQLEKVIQVNPNHAKSYFLLGMVRLLDKNKDLDGFRGYMKKAIQADPHYVNAYNTLAIVNYSADKIEEATALLEEGKTQMPQEESLYFNQALIFIFKEQYEPAIKNLEKLITLNAGDQEYYYVSGIAYKKLGHSVKARKAMEQVIRLDPKHIYALLIIATTYKEEDDWEKAFDYVERARRIAPKDPKVLAELQEYKEAYERWKKGKGKQEE